eukprot:Hpha_TRINITY_DN15207_c1_g1::TRINITY_DN15207_c1_g1_i1::g.66982::m.66982
MGTMRLHLTSGTLAAITMRVRDQEQQEATASIGTAASAIDTAVDRTGGSVALIHGSMVLGAWNAAGRPCMNHAIQAARCAWMLADASGDVLSFGAASGPVLHGHVTTTKHKFVLALGQAQELADRLGKAATALGTFALVAGCVGELSAAEDPSIRPECRAVDIWPLELSLGETHSGGKSIIVVYELGVPNATEDDGAWGCILREPTNVSSHGTQGSEEWFTALLKAYGPHSSRATRDDALTTLRGIRARQSTAQGPNYYLDTMRTEPSFSSFGSKGSIMSLRGRARGSRTPNDDASHVTSATGMPEIDVLGRVIANVDAGIHLTTVPIQWVCPFPGTSSTQYTQWRTERRTSRRRSQSFQTLKSFRSGVSHVSHATPQREGIRMTGADHAWGDRKAAGTRAGRRRSNSELTHSTARSGVKDSQTHDPMEMMIAGHLGDLSSTLRLGEQRGGSSLGDLPPEMRIRSDSTPSSAGVPSGGRHPSFL